MKTFEKDMLAWGWLKSPNGYEYTKQTKTILVHKYNKIRKISKISGMVTYVFNAESVGLIDAWAMQNKSIFHEEMKFLGYGPFGVLKQRKNDIRIKIKQDSNGLFIKGITRTQLKTKTFDSVKNLCWYVANIIDGGDVYKTEYGLIFLRDIIKIWQQTNSSNTYKFMTGHLMKLDQIDRKISITIIAPNGVRRTKLFGFDYQAATQWINEDDEIRAVSKLLKKVDNQTMELRDIHYKLFQSIPNINVIINAFHKIKFEIVEQNKDGTGEVYICPFDSRIDMKIYISFNADRRVYKLELAGNFDEKQNLQQECAKGDENFITYEAEFSLEKTPADMAKWIESYLPRCIKAVLEKTPHKQKYESMKQEMLPNGAIYAKS